MRGCTAPNRRLISMIPKPALAFLASATASALIWVLSPLLTGHTEPWDADGQFYFSALVLAGLCAGALIPRSLHMHYLGAVAGQLGYELWLGNVGALFLLGAVFLLIYSTIFVAAAMLASGLRIWIGERSSDASSSRSDTDNESP